MTHGFHKKKSKRIPARLRYKVEKRVRDHHRKLKKEAKKNRDPTVKRKKPIAVIPGNVPFKEEIIQEARQVKEREIERKKLLKSLLKGDTNMKAIMKDKPDFKLNSKKKQIAMKKKLTISSILKCSTLTSKSDSNDGESMQCD